MSVSIAYESSMWTVQFWQPAFVNGTHFIEWHMMATQQDVTEGLVELVRWLQNNQEEAEQIGKAGHTFMQQVLTPHNVSHLIAVYKLMNYPVDTVAHVSICIQVQQYWIRLIEEYAGLLRDPVIKHPSADYLDDSISRPKYIASQAERCTSSIEGP